MNDYTIVQRSLLALGLVAAAVLFLAPVEDAAVTRGRKLFDRAFAKSEGLGAPEMNADSCRGCHSDPVLGGAGALELNVTRFGRDNGGVGPFTNLPGGQLLSRLRPPHDPWREEAAEQADCFEQRQTPTLLGAGLIDGVFDAAIVANEDPNDLNGDGVRGVARRIPVNGLIEIGRFGWKAQIPRLADFVRDAMMGELGITTPDDGRGFAPATDGDAVADPELSAQQAADVLAFMAALPAPQRVGSFDPLVALGQQVFGEVGCTKCHVPALQGVNGPVPLFSDLLLHNVMDAGYRGMAEPGAGVGMFRTPPLWGIRDTAPYMHDGRAETLFDAIQAHAGEAQAVRAAFLARPAADQNALLLFLADL
jgi:cytochrome c553